MNQKIILSEKINNLYLINYLFQFNIFFQKSLLTQIKFIFFIKKINYFINKNKLFLTLTNNYIELNHSNYFNINTKFYINIDKKKLIKNIDCIAHSAPINDKHNISKIYFLKKINLVNTKLINLFFLFNYSLFNSKFKKTNHFLFFYLQTKKKKTIIINMKKFLNRWIDGLALLYNIFFYKLNPLFFSSPLFKHETISLNWYHHNWKFSFWKYNFNYYIFKTNKPDVKFEFFLLKLKEKNINFFLITDCQYHFKNIFSFKRLHFFTLGLIPSFINPWIVEYPLISFLNNYLIQLFFFKLIIFLNKQVLFNKYFFYKNIWLKIISFKHI